MNNQNNTSRSLSVFAVAAFAGAFVSGFASGCVQDLNDGDGSDVADLVDADGDAKAIIGGAATTIDQHPWQISLQSFGSHFCGGSIIGDRWVLTAQHCVDGETASALTVVAGASRLANPGEGQTRQVTQIIRFPGYTSPEFGKDVALLQLAQPLTFNAKVQAIALAVDADNASPAGAVATISGWGTTRSGGSSLPDQLKTVTVPVVANATAQRAYTETITADQLSAGTGGRDSCQGDSGGPLSAPAARGRVLIGVVSWGYGCGDANYPGLYARVTSFASWISTNTGIAIGGANTNPGQVTPTPVPVSPSTLFDRAVTGARGSFQHFTVTVPAGATALDVVLTGTDGDADLYVRKGSRPTGNAFDCRPFTDSTNESCSFTGPAAGTWYVSVAGYTAFNAAHLVVTAR